jgi:diacylglycerol kinase family enzyme
VRAQDRKDPAFPPLLREPAEAIIVAGGDGTVADVIRRIPNRDLPLGILPLGTANNIAASFGIVGEIEQIAARWERASPRSLDLFEVIGPWGRHLLIESLGLGSLALAQKRARAENLPEGREIAAARRALRETLAEARAQPVRLYADGRDIGGDLLCLECLNIARMGPGLTMAPEADPGDGKLDILAVREAGRAALLDWLDDPALSPCPLPALRAHDVRLEWNDGVLRLDDEFPERWSEQVTVRIRHAGQTARILA